MNAKYLKDAPKETKLVTVSARVPEELHQQFQRAAAQAKSIGKELSITPVVIAALEEAVQELLQAASMTAEQLAAVSLDEQKAEEPAPVKAGRKAKGNTKSRKKPTAADQMPLSGT